MIHHLQHFEILVKCVNRNISTESFYNISKTIEYLFVFRNISESLNCNVAIKYFAIFLKKVETIFQTCFCNLMCYLGRSVTVVKELM